MGYLLHGDRPWRLGVDVSRRPRPVGRAAVRLALLAALCAVVWAGAVLVASALAVPATALTAALGGRLWAVEVIWYGGGRPPLSGTEFIDWSVHDTLSSAEREHQAAIDRNKARAKR